MLLNLLAPRSGFEPAITLLDLLLDRGITQDEYDKKAHELKQRQTEIALRIEQHQKGEGDFRITLEGLISLASRVRNCSTVRK
jgi:hypothetical protein